MSDYFDGLNAALAELHMEHDHCTTLGWTERARGISTCIQYIEQLAQISRGSGPQIPKKSYLPE